MKVRIINFRTLIGISLLLVCLGLTGAFLRPNAQPDESLPARFGDVPWNHDLHARMESIASCTVCHHTEQAGNAQPKPCSHCHTRSVEQALITPEMFMEVPQKKYSGENGPELITALHNKCIGCHRAMQKGPVACGDCHKQTFSGIHGRVDWDHRLHARGLDMNDQPGLDDNCLHCHHQDKKAASDGDYRACGTCHKPVISHDGMSIKTEIKKHETYIHGECQNCHTLYNPENDAVTCQECHKGIQVDKEKEERPVLEQVVHQRCAECHNKDYANLTDGMPVTCDDCHKPDPSWLEVPDDQVILWDHKAHSDYKNVDCTTCHHTDSPDEYHMACYKCHASGVFENPPVAIVLKKTCVECHADRKIGLDTWESMNSEKAVQSYYRYEGEEGSFWWNHRGHAVDYSFSCQNCHHYLIKKDGKYIMAEKTTTEWPEKAHAIQTCRNCHGEEGPVAESAAVGSKAPVFKKAFQKICTDCHVKLAGGPQTWEAFFQVEPKEKPEQQEDQNP